jgi:hypothetical protein
MKKTIIKYAIIVLVLGGLLGCIGYLVKINKRLNFEVAYANNNLKAFAAENDSLINQSLVFKFTIDQLSTLNDSISNKLLAVKKELKVKDREISSLQYYKENFNKVDTITLYKVDTIFAPNVDTLLEIGDEWYSLKLSLSFPDSIVTNLSVNNEKYIVTRILKETVDTPKKCRIARWFQKKQNIIQVDVVDKNPYMQTETQRFVEIVK